MGKWRDEARKEAKDFAIEYLSDIVNGIMENEGETEKVHANDYDEYASERFGSESYSLLEAAGLLEDLSDYESEDNYRWEGLQIREAINVAAQQTYLDAFFGLFNDLMNDINSAISSAEGHDFHWTLQDALDHYRHEEPSAVLDWRPGQKTFSDLPDWKQAEMEEKHLLKVRKKIEQIVKKEIKG